MGVLRNVSGVCSKDFCLWGKKQLFIQVHPRGKNTAELLPEDDVWFRDRRMRREEGDDSVGVSSRYRGEKGGGVEGTGVEEVG